MKQTVLLLIFASAICVKAHAQINKIEHFYASSPNAEKLFNFFYKDLRLPIVWDYKTWGDFSSGAVSLGNVAFELVNFKGQNKTSFDGIALEPRKHVEDFIKELDREGVEHDAIQSNTWKNDKGILVGWSNLVIKNILPVEAGLFICDYKNREGVLAGRMKASKELKDLNGGSLGIISLREIVIGTTHIKINKAELKKLSGIKKGKKGLYHFSDGPSIRLKSAKSNGTEKIIINVQSLATARKFLQDKNWLGNITRNSISISPQAVEGLNIQLVEQD